MAPSAQPVLGSELALLPKPLFRELRAFREGRGYGGPLVASQGEGPSGVRRVVLEQRLTEVRALLAAPDLPPPADAFEGYSLLVHLCLAVDNKYLGPFRPSHRVLDRPICQTPEFFGAAHPADGVIGVLPELVFLLEPGRVELVPRTPGNPMPFEVAADDPFAPLRRYAWRDVRPFPAPAMPSKQERMRQYFSFLGRAPAPENRLQCYALTNWLFGALEGRHRVLPGASEASWMFTTLPSMLHECVGHPQADVVLSMGHAMFYYADGSTEIFARDRARDAKDGARPAGMVLTRRECRIEGRPRRAAA
jgi:hypothetical protein